MAWSRIGGWLGRKTSVESTAEVVLYTTDDPLASLPLDLSIETMGGWCTVLIPRGTPLPCAQRETFSTAEDSQTAIDVHLFQGVRPRARNQRPIVVARLCDIPSAPRAVPRLGLAFAVDAGGVLTLRAAGARLEIREEAPLDARAMREILADARAAQEEDDLSRAWLAALIELQNLVYTECTGIRTDRAPAEIGAAYERAFLRAEAVLAALDPGEPADPGPLRASVTALRAAIDALPMDHR
ncbi:MAG: Hsp70 family protein [Myxococcota bacterium]